MVNPDSLYCVSIVNPIRNKVEGVLQVRGGVLIMALIRGGWRFNNHFTKCEIVGFELDTTWQ
jgi:hypothetical protein